MIYVHVPLCRSFCTYCGFYSEKCSDAAAEKTVDSVVKEISLSEIPLERNTIYMGGGTPSVLPPFLLQKIVRACSDACFRSAGRVVPEGGLWKWDEFTFEANPDDIVRKGLDYVRNLASLGVDRVSLGAQSFSDDVLRWMNRRHGAADISTAVRLLREGGIHNISLDFIFGISFLSDDVLSDSIHRAVDLGVQHISCYQLSVEEGSALENLIARGRYKEASPELCSRQYELVCGILSEAGFNHYEISNFARPGFEARHNSSYWEHIPYIGFGPGAHSLLVDGAGKWIRRWNKPDLNSYIEGSFARGEEVLSEEQMKMETIMLGLRTASGVDSSALGTNEYADRLLSKGLLQRTGGRIRIPEKYFFISDNIIRDLV